MDFVNRAPSQNGHNRAGAPVAAPQTSQAASMPPKKAAPSATPFMHSKWLRGSAMLLLFSLTGIFLLVMGILYVGGNRELKYVDTKEYQAVFLTNNQVYFGHIHALTDGYVDLQNIFYLNNQSSQTSNATNASSSLSLVKLGCEVHGPQDEMIINRSQVSFWENLRSNGQVATAIGTWIKQNPNGQTCNTSTGSTTQSTGAGGSTTPSTPTSTSNTNSTKQ